jgi:hypothetical protein
VQPKKETVRINLPPKPTAAPTIKLPTLPPGGPTGASSPVPAVVGAPVAIAPPSGLRTAAAAAAPIAKPGAAPAAGTRPGATTPRPGVPPAAPSIKLLDKALIIAACITSLIAVGGVTWVFLTLKSSLENFST